jgi:hypothetical protein
VLVDLDQVPIVEAGAANRVLVDPKTELADQVQRTQGGGAKPRNIAGVGGNFGLHQHDVKRTRHRARA